MGRKNKKSGIHNTGINERDYGLYYGQVSRIFFTIEKNVDRGITAEGYTDDVYS